VCRRQQSLIEPVREFPDAVLLFASSQPVGFELFTDAVNVPFLD